MRADFDHSLGHVSPGTNLFRQMLEPLFDRGFSRYYLGPGNNAYKQHWAEQGEQMQNVRVYNRTLRGRAERFRELAVKPVLHALHDRLRPHRDDPKGMCEPAP